MLFTNTILFLQSAEVYATHAKYTPILTQIQIHPHTTRRSVCNLTQTWAMCLWEQFARLVTYGFRAYYGKLENRRLDAACSLRVGLSPFTQACVDGKSFALA